MEESGFVTPSSIVAVSPLLAPDTVDAPMPFDCVASGDGCGVGGGVG